MKGASTMDTLFYHGNFITMDPAQPRAQAMLIRDGDIRAVGARETLLAQADHSVRQVDLEGKTVLPGFTESHMHVLALGMFLRDVNLQTANGVGQVIELGRRYIQERQLPPGTWVRGRGWNQDNFLDENRFLSRYDLDKISRDHPIAFTRTCGHAIVVNSRALALLGMSETAPHIDGGQIDLDENGTPLGVFRELARKLVLDAIPELTEDELRELISLAGREALAHGVTTIHTDDFKDVPNNFQKVIDVYTAMEADGTLPVRIYHQCNLPAVSKIQAFLDRGYRTGWGSERFRLGPLKLLADGSLGARTAYLRAPYADQADTRGIRLFPQEELDAMLLLAHKNGMQLAIHAIGDGALDMVLEAVEKARAAHPRSGERHGVIHCQITAPEQLDRMKALELMAYIQPIFLNYDVDIVEERVGAQRAATSYNWKEFLDKGIPTSGGSDCPVESLDIMENIYTAVTRKNLAGRPAGGWRPDQCLTVEEALALFTTGGAYASFEEGRKGTLTPGKLADFVVLDADPLAVDPEDIKQIRVEATYLDGQQVYCRTR